MSKPDRFERAVAKQVAVDECGPNTIWAQSAVMLLRKEHAECDQVYKARDNFMEGVESMRRERTALQREYAKVCDERDRLEQQVIELTHQIKETP